MRGGIVVHRYYILHLINSQLELLTRVHERSVVEFVTLYSPKLCSELGNANYYPTSCGVNTYSYDIS